MIVNQAQNNQESVINQVVEQENLVKNNEVQKIGIELIKFLQNNAILTQEQKEILETLERRAEINIFY